MPETGPLTRKVLDFTTVIQDLVPTVQQSDDWAPLARFVDIDAFERIGTSLEVQDWAAYTRMMTRYASSVDRFETTVRRVTEIAPLVYYEIEERHLRDSGEPHVVNSMTVFEFGEDGTIRHLDVYLQQAR